MWLLSKCFQFPCWKCMPQGLTPPVCSPLPGLCRLAGWGQPLTSPSSQNAARCSWPRAELELLIFNAGRADAACECKCSLGKGSSCAQWECNKTANNLSGPAARRRGPTPDSQSCELGGGYKAAPPASLPRADGSSSAEKLQQLCWAKPGGPEPRGFKPA